MALFYEIVVLYSEAIDYSIKNFYKIENNIDDGIRSLRIHYRKSPIPKTTYFIYLCSIFIGGHVFPKIPKQYAVLLAVMDTNLILYKQLYL